MAALAFSRAPGRQTWSMSLIPVVFFVVFLLSLLVSGAHSAYVEYVQTEWTWECDSSTDYFDTLTKTCKACNEGSVNVNKVSRK